VSVVRSRPWAPILAQQIHALTMVYPYLFEGFVCRILLPHVAREFPNLPADGASGRDMDATYQGRRGAF
jgi:hypothetical protein